MDHLKAVLTVHLVASLGWIGAVLAYLAIGVRAASSTDPDTIRALWAALDIVGSTTIVPLAVAALASGVTVSVVSPWRLLRHWWVLISLVLTAIATTVTVLHMPSVRDLAARAEIASPAELANYGGDLLHPGAGLVVLLGVTVLNVYKPRGRLRPSSVNQQAGGR